MSLAPPYLPMMDSHSTFLSVLSSNINEVIRAVLNSLFFLRKDFTHTKSTKSIKNTKQHRDPWVKAQKRK